MHSIAACIERIGPIAPEYRRAAPPPPRSVKIEMAARGGANGPSRSGQARLRDRTEIEPAFYRRLLREIRELAVEELGLCYLGEPFQCRWLPEAIRYAKQECGYSHVFLTTNGRMASAPRVRECMEAGLDSLTFSFECENLEAARRVRDEVAAAIGHRCAVEVHDKDGEPRAGAMMRPLPCTPLFTQGHITIDGRLSACWRDDEPRFDMGNLVHHGFMRAWHSQPFQRLRRAHLAGELEGTPCERCMAATAPKG